jgi:acetolactate synthase I/II/III large subunit
LKLSDYLMRFLGDRGVKHVFFVPGGAAMHLNDSLGREKRIEVVSNLHEQASAIAADAYGKVANQLGVASVTAGPGGTNAVTGVAAAYLDSTACLFFSGQVKRADLKGNTGLRQLGVQEIDIVSIVSPITKYAVQVTEPNSIRYHLERACHLATTGRRGPVWLDLPLDVQAASIDPESLPGFVPGELADIEAPDLELQVANALALLDRAERPVLLAGNGIRLAGAQAEFLRFAERMQIPILTTWLGLDLLPETHPLFVGRPGSIAPRGANFALQNSDWLLGVGARFDMALTGYAHDRLARAAKKVIVDIDAAEIGKLKTQIDLPICTDARAFFAQALLQTDRVPLRDRSPWLLRCAEWKRKYPVVTPEHRAMKDKVSTYIFSEVLSQELDEGEILASCSAGAAIEIFLLAYKAKAGQRVFHARGLGAMGFGLPSAIGACLAAGRRRTICVEGDGGFSFNIQELETVARMKLPIKVFVLNNRGYSSIRTSQNRYFAKLVGADDTSGLSLPDSVRLAAAYGLATARIDTPARLAEQIREVLATPGPVVCEIMGPDDEPRAPSLTSVQRPDGSMMSKPLEDLWPFLDRAEFRANMLIEPIEES